VVGFTLRSNMSAADVSQEVMAKTEGWQGTLALMILRTLESIGPLLNATACIELAGARNCRP
jgi:hypothetical protein